MPPAQKPSTRQGAPTKTKGAARAKSGCYTCRIRRKKCDEENSDRGGCKTCDRLHLECLGYGVKRPEWLRESQTVVDIRNRIKTFLASQGMIKGHSGSYSRGADQDDQTFLVLRPDYHGSPDTESSTMSGGIRSPSPPNLYHEPWESHPTYPLSSIQCHDGPFFQVPRAPIECLELAPMSRPPPIECLDTLHFSRAPIEYLETVQTPRLQIDSIFDDTCVDDQFQELIAQTPRITHCPPTMHAIYDPVAQYYGIYVFDSQYLLSNKPQIRQIVIDSIHSHTVSKKIVQILSELHFRRKRLPHRTEEIPLILHLLKSTGTGNLDDAMAVLHSVSAYLFNGGDGAWDECIDFAAEHVNIVLETKFYGIPNPLQLCDTKTAFIIKTAIWFDVLASITTQKPPRLRDVINRLFNPSRSQIQEIGDPLSDQCSMLSPMGCENDVVWALSEISALAHWKRQQESKRRLSLPELVAKGKEIEKYLDSPICNQPCRDDPDAASHYAAASIFRSAARLYLATVISGDHPLVCEVGHGAQMTYTAISTIHHDIWAPVVRSTVFAFFLCGCFLLNPVHQKHIKDMLLFQDQYTEIGNCRSIVTLLESIWANSNPEHPQPIPWQMLLREKHILLV
ncbi:hypothetical protein APHAL10511_004505 [Amanita phalloides]|nr:hypothetical protein APHAL10511_004505 [Amanita phalloides]